MADLKAYGVRNEGWLKPFGTAIALICAYFFMKWSGLAKGGFILQILAILFFMGIGIKAGFIDTTSAKVMKYLSPVIAVLLSVLFINFGV
ncbi:hypothetical protein FSJ73_020625 [Escherichia coli]|nr:hypothetical protein [Escherichia coli]